MNALKQLWKRSPKLRFAARTVVVGIAGAVWQSWRQGTITDWATLKAAVTTAAITAITGLITPLEPFVGVNKAKVDVPSPPAVPGKS